jgi:cell division protein FtsB
MSLIRRKDGRIHPWKVAGIIVIALAILVPFCTGSRGLFTLIRLHREVGRMKQDIVTTTQENATIQDTIKALESEDPEALEREARNLGMIKPGETVYKVVPAEK